MFGKFTQTTKKLKMVNGLRNNKRHSSVFRTTARFISIVAIMVLGGQILSAQEKGFLSVFEDNKYLLGACISFAI